MAKFMLYPIFFLLLFTTRSIFSQDTLPTPAYDPSALSFCSKYMLSSGGKISCLRLIRGKKYDLRGHELCKRIDSNDSDRLKCLQTVAHTPSNKLLLDIDPLQFQALVLNPLQNALKELEDDGRNTKAINQIKNVLEKLQGDKGFRLTE